MKNTHYPCSKSNFCFSDIRFQYLLFIFFLPLLWEGQGEAFAQINNPDIKRTNHWYFGEKAGLDFSSGEPVAVTDGQMNVTEGCASIADTTGNLLFYSNGVNVWNRNHQIIPNGFGLHGGPGTSSTQGTLIVPMPGSENLFYIFYSWLSPDSSYLKYSILDINLNSGLGDIINKNITLLESPTEKLCAIKHNNGSDIWIITTKQNTNNFYAYLLNSSGLNTPPVITSIGNIDNTFTCHLKSSPKGNKICVGATSSGIQIFDFDNTTGVLFNPIIFPPCNQCQDYGIEFSPSGKKVFVTRFFPPPQTLKPVVMQVDLSSNDSLTIVNSLELVDTIKDAFAGGAIQMASNKKLYVAKFMSTDSTIGIIHNPNLSAQQCNYDNTGIYLEGRNSTLGLPNFISSWFCDSSLVSTTEIPNSTAKIITYPNPFTEHTTVIFPFTGNIALELYDLQGKKQSIKSRFSAYENNIKITLERNGLSEGIYLLNIQHNNQIYSQKLIITN